MLTGFLVGDRTKGTTGSVMSERQLPGERKPVCPSSALKKKKKKKTLELVRLLDTLQRCMSFSTP